VSEIDVGVQPSVVLARSELTSVRLPSALGGQDTVKGGKGKDT
jgi:hypothetical protein